MLEQVETARHTITVDDFSFRYRLKKELSRAIDMKTIHFLRHAKSSWDDFELKILIDLCQQEEFKMQI